MQAETMRSMESTSGGRVDNEIMGANVNVLKVFSVQSLYYIKRHRYILAQHVYRWKEGKSRKIIITKQHQHITR